MVVTPSPEKNSDLNVADVGEFPIYDIIVFSSVRQQVLEYYLQQAILSRFGNRCWQGQMESMLHLINAKFAFDLLFL